MPVNPKTQKKLDDAALDLCRLLGEHTGERTGANAKACEQVERHAVGLAAAMKILDPKIESKVKDALTAFFELEPSAKNARKASGRSRS